MVSDIVCVLLFCTLLHTASLTGWNPDLRLQGSRNYVSEAKVKSIQDILLQPDSSASNLPHFPQSNAPSQGHRSHQKYNNHGPQHTVSDSSWYRPHQKKGYEIYEEPEEPGSNLQQSVSQQPNTGNLGLPYSALSTGKTNLQVHRLYSRKPTELLEDTVAVSELGDASRYQRPRGHLDEVEIKSLTPGLTLMYQTSPTHFPGNVGGFPNPHIMYGQYPEILPGLTGLRLAQSINPLTAVMLASSLGIPAPLLAA
jgi:hypothetical protein